MIRVIPVPYGRPALIRLHELITEVKADDPLSPVSVLVPSNYVGVSTRRLLASGRLGDIGGRPGLAGIDLLTTYRLAELLGAPRLAARQRRPLSTPVVAAVIRGVLADTTTMFAAVSEHPSTEKALVRVHRELRDLDEAQLDVLAAQSDRAKQVVALHRETARRLAADWYDEFDLFDSATEVIAERPAVASERGHLVLHLPQTLTAAGARLLRTFGEHAPLTVLTGVSGATEADAGVVEIASRLGASYAPPPVEQATATRVITVSDPDDEVRTVIRDVVEAMVEGVPLESMAVLYGSDEPYARLLDEQLAAAGITRNGAAVRRVDESVVGRTVLSLLALPDRDFGRGDVMGLVASAPIREIAGERRLTPVNAWERLSREAGIVGGPDEWTQRLEQLVTSARDVIARVEDPDDRRVSRANRAIAQADRLETFVAELVRSLGTARVPPSWSGKATWVRSLVERYLGPDVERTGWPEIEVLAAEKIDDALDRLSGLDDVEDSPSLATFRRTLELELESGLGRTGTFGEGVFVGRVGHALGIDLERVFLVGMAEGVLPARHRDDSLLPDHERTLLGGALELVSDRVHNEHRAVLAALAGAADTRTLYFPRGDLRRSSDRMPSRWLLDTITVLNGERVWSDELGGVARSDAEWITEVPSFVGGLRSTSFPATDQEYELRSLLDHHEAGDSIGDHHLLDLDPDFARGVELVRSRASNRFTRHDGDLRDVITTTGVRLDIVSATRLEAWASCPHRYFVQHVLGVEKLDQPEALLQISPLDRGSLIHEALDQFLTEMIDAGEAPGPGEPWADAAQDRLLAIAERCCDDYERRGLVGKQLFWRRDRRAILSDLLATLAQDLERHHGRAIASELGFGLPDSAHPPLQHTLPNGRTIRFRGSADRLERTDDGGLVVIDYKTGSDRTYSKMMGDTDDPVKSGTKLQLPIYALAARAAIADAEQVHAAYWFTSSKYKFKWIGYDVDDRVLTRFDDVLTAIVDGIDGGLFPAKPTNDHFQYFVDCDYCDPDGLGTLGRRREWERKRHDPILRPYLELAEPEALLDA